jgi:hypothetical protein
MGLKRGLELVKAAFVAAGAPYALIGGFALSVHGYPRATNDLDYLVHGDFRDAVNREMVARGFVKRFTSDEVDQWDGEVPVDVIYARRDLSKKMLQRAAAFEPLGGTLVINPTDLIGLKIQAYSNNPKRLLQDLADIQKMAELNQIDWEQVKAYAEAFGEWERIKSFKR